MLFADPLPQSHKHHWQTLECINLIGYARTSTTEQVNGLEALRVALKAIGCDNMHNKQTSATGPRRALAEALGYVRGGDILVVAKLDRLARSVGHLGEII